MIDVLAFELDEARARLEAAGLRVEVAETRSPRPVVLVGPLRVVRQRQAPDGAVHLVVVRERYVPAARSSSTAFAVPPEPAGA